MNIYYELSESVTTPDGRYFAAYDVGDTPSIKVTRYGNLMLNSERAWGEHDDGRVYFIKNKLSVTYETPVDMKEFFWVKLKSVTV